MKRTEIYAIDNSEDDKDLLDILSKVREMIKYCPDITELENQSIHRILDDKTGFTWSASLSWW
jgi:hypothetical protein